MPKVPLWPMASFVNDTQSGAKNLVLLVLKSSSFKITSNLASCDIISENVKLYRNILFPARMQLDNSKPGDTLATELSIEVVSQGCPKYPDESMDESCNFNLLVFLSSKKAF